jgi:hypothetical protein
MQLAMVVLGGWTQLQHRCGICSSGRCVEWLCLACWVLRFLHGRLPSCGVWTSHRICISDATHILLAAFP